MLVLVSNSGNEYTQSDLTISRISVSTYASIPNKLTEGRPIQVYVERLRDNPKINVWPVPRTLIPVVLTPFISGLGASFTSLILLSFFITVL